VQVKPELDVVRVPIMCFFSSCVSMPRSGNGVSFTRGIEDLSLVGFLGF
jgi:hypothetical protein